MQPPQQIDPSLASQQNQGFYSYPPAGPFIQGLSSPSGSESVGTPSDTSFNLKRSSSVVGNNEGGGTGNKRPRKDESGDQANEKEPKAKSTRGSRACTNCRRLKMKCVGAEQSPPCNRCQSGNHECIFEESNRGKRSNNPRKHEVLARSMRKIERTLDTVLRSLGNPSTVSAMLSRSSSPVGLNDNRDAVVTPQRIVATRELMDSDNESPPQSPQEPAAQGSPKLHSLPNDTLNPLGLLAETSLATRKTNSQHHGTLYPRPFDDTGTAKVGVASEVYFKPGPINILPLRRLYIENRVQPEMLNFTSTEDVLALFNIYFDHMNGHSKLLDRKFHTPSLVCSRSPFLLTTICAIAAKFYPEKPDLHAKLTDISKKLAFSVPEHGYKSLEIVQAYLLLTLYGSGAVERYEQDRTWMLLGMAIRMATDLNIHRKSKLSDGHSEEDQARNFEIHNRERTWLVCYSLDRSISAQMGKPYGIREDYIIRNAKKWCTSKMANPNDAAITAYVEYQRIMSRCMDLLYSGTTSPSGLQMDCDYLTVIQNVESQLIGWYEEWLPVVVAHADEYVALNGKFFLHYGMLVINSFGLQDAIERNPVNIGNFFGRVHKSAVACISVMKDNWGPKGYLKYSPDSTFVQGSYAVLTLLKLLRPELKSFVDEEKTIKLVKELADTLENVAVGPLHTPRLYSTFLKAVIASKTGAAMNEEREGFENGEPSEPPTSPSIHTSPSTSIQSPHLQAGTQLGMISPNHPPGELASPMPAPPPTNGVFQSYDYYFQNDGEMGTVVDISTFPPTMADHDQSWPALSIDSILSTTFWGDVLVPGTSGSLTGLSGGFAYGPGVSGLITPGFGMSPTQSGLSTPHHSGIPASTDHMMQSHAHHQMALDPRQQDVRC
ncbi:hypothetical protein BDM02DRAFT_3190029 [Thelephora ganbajun]|uniref:Uncharacterized protein n=1 Tax=Thelephora ganbajun TaxID=370292 RepID=A0ACB6Z710_THEGA|nr:hypothetical protein BDM02DRAFT_3190029 [Thelephora ganbajun]